MANYMVNNNATTKALSIGGTQTQIAIIAQGGARPRFYDIMFGPGGVPAGTDCEIIYDFVVKSSTAAGTAGVALATQPSTDAANANSNCQAATNYTAEPTTYTAATGIAVGLNQRASFRWVAVPGSEIVAVNTSNTGYGLRAKSSNNISAVTCSVLWAE